jgi:hypothetical protein
MTHHHFKAPWGRSLIIVSLFSTLLIVTLAIIMATGGQQPWFISLPCLSSHAFTVMLALLLPAGALPFIIRGYTITGDSILIHRLWWNTILPLKKIRSVNAKPLAMSDSFRTCGNGGLYSFTGWYWSRNLGCFHAYVTDLNRTVVVRMVRRTAVLSPDDPENFARITESRLHHT